MLSRDLADCEVSPQALYAFRDDQPSERCEWAKPTRCALGRGLRTSPHARPIGLRIVRGFAVGRETRRSGTVFQPDPARCTSNRTCVKARSRPTSQ
jgi:hypothetical protein